MTLIWVVGGLTLAGIIGVGLSLIRMSGLCSRDEERREQEYLSAYREHEGDTDGLD